MMKRRGMRIFIGLFAAVVGMAGLGVATLSEGVRAKAKEENICNDKEIKNNPEFKELLKAAGCLDKEDKDKTFMSTAAGLIQVVLSLVGIGAVGVIVYGGVSYATSIGDSGKATKARNIIIYGVAGLLVSLLAWAIVHFVSLSISS